MKTHSKGFTLIELMVSLAILGVIVVICGRIFEQSNTSWNTGTRKAEVNMVGRGLASFIAQDVSRCVSIESGSLTFTVLDDGAATNAGSSVEQVVKYDLGGPITRKQGSGAADQLAPFDSDIKASAEFHKTDQYVDILVKIKHWEYTEELTFASRAWLININRKTYDYDVY